MRGVRGLFGIMSVVLLPSVNVIRCEEKKGGIIITTIDHLITYSGYFFSNITVKWGYFVFFNSYMKI